MSEKSRREVGRCCVSRARVVGSRFLPQLEESSTASWLLAPERHGKREREREREWEWGREGYLRPALITVQASFESSHTGQQGRGDQGNVTSAPRKSRSWGLKGQRDMLILGPLRAESATPPSQAKPSSPPFSPQNPKQAVVNSTPHSLVASRNVTGPD